MTGGHCTTMHPPILTWASFETSKVCTQVIIAHLPLHMGQLPGAGTLALDRDSAQICLAS